MVERCNGRWIMGKVGGIFKTDFDDRTIRSVTSLIKTATFAPSVV